MDQDAKGADTSMDDVAAVEIQQRAAEPDRDVENHPKIERPCPDQRLKWYTSRILEDECRSGISSHEILSSNHAWRRELA
jgi:hypothetical protein